MRIKTSRLLLYPLKAHELPLLAQGSKVLALHKGWMPVEWVLESGIEAQLTAGLPHWVALMAQHPKARGWCSPWVIVQREGRRMVGILGFEGLPDAAGECALGYAMDVACHGRGLMTEALAAVVHWAERNGKLVRLVAETSRYNYASQRVLHKVGFEQTADEDARDTLRWIRNTPRRGMAWRIGD